VTTGNGHVRRNQRSVCRNPCGHVHRNVGHDPGISGHVGPEYSLKDNDSNDGGKKTSPNAKCLPFPKLTSLGVVQRAQRHVADSITTLRYYLSAALIRALGTYPYC
jgi:hypothetical protein